MTSSNTGRTGGIARRSPHFIALTLGLGVLSACGLPRGGPQAAEIFEGSVQRQGDAFILEVNDRVTRIASVDPALGFGRAFMEAQPVGADTIRPGDMLGLRIFENVEQGLLAPAGGAGATLDQVQVDGDGFIFVPFAGRIRAAGTTPERLRQIITDRLEPQTPDPQVIVSRIAGDGATVSVAGGVGAQGVYPIVRGTRTLSAMLAAAGGVTVPAEIAQITVVRGSHRGTVWFRDLYDDPRLDIAVMPGDRILVEADARGFAVLGATGAQSRVTFQTQTLSAVEAIAQVGGLNPSLADPTGVFVLRTEPEEIANRLLGRDDLRGSQRIVYVLDLTTPNGLFLARDFAIRDDDLLYVTEAPYTQFQKALSAVTGSLTPVANVATLAP